MVARLDLRIQELVVRAATKTLDHVFVNMKIVVQFNVQNPYDAYCKLANLVAKIESHLFDVVRAKQPLLKLDHAFEAKDEIADPVRSQLADIMHDFGYKIVKALMTDIDPDI